MKRQEGHQVAQTVFQSTYFTKQMGTYLILNSKQDEEENREISNELTAKEIHF